MTMRSESQSKLEDGDLATVRRRKEHGREFQAMVARLARLTSELTMAVEGLEFVELPPMESQAGFYEEVRRFEISLIERALNRTGGSQVRAARLLEMNTTTLNTKIKVYEMDWPARWFGQGRDQSQKAPPAEERIAIRGLR